MSNKVSWPDFVFPPINLWVIGPSRVVKDESWSKSNWQQSPIWKMYHLPPLKEENNEGDTT